MNPVEDIDSTKRDFFIKIAKMYYLEGLSQQEIADKVGASRSNISKVLKTCRDLKLVEIRINDTSSSGLLLQNEMKEAFGLSQVIVVPTGDSPEATMFRLGRAAADLLQSLMDGGMSVGMSWGKLLVSHGAAIQTNQADGYRGDSAPGRNGSMRSSDRRA